MLFELKPIGIWSLAIEGLKQPMILLLLAIAAISLVFSELVQAVVMIFVVMAYIAIELINKVRTDRTLQRLRELTQPTSTVIRNGGKLEVNSTELVGGDLVVLYSGTRVPADGRLIESKGLLVDESALTGESLPVRKEADAIISDDAPIGERTNSAFSGTVIVDGEGVILLTAVGGESEFGKIAKGVQAVERERTDLQSAMVSLAKILAAVAIIVSLIIPVVGYLRGFGYQQMVLTWLALTFLLIPGQPPIIITMALALASFELAKKNIVAKRLRGTEILGSVTAIVTDKTGTLTENKMRVEAFVSPDGILFSPDSFDQNLKQSVFLSLPEHSKDPTDETVLEAIGLKSSTKVSPDVFVGFARGQPWRVLIYKEDGRLEHFFAGSPEMLINSSHLSGDYRKNLMEILNRESAAGKRVVAYARLTSDRPITERLEGLNLVALAILMNPVRDGVKAAIASLESARVRTFIVTGDHAKTTKFVAEQIGLGGNVITGDLLGDMNDEELRQSLRTTRVFARISPEQKVRIVKALQANGEEVAVIGDGINDAPAIRSANVGIAMGKVGTDLAKETADLVLTDDNYVHIPDAVGIGRKALDNFRKGLTYYLTAKAILLSIFIIPLIPAIPFPLVPIQIIVIELLMDLASSTIFVTEQAEQDVMSRGPIRVQNLLGFSLLRSIFTYGIGLVLGIISIYFWLYYQTGDVVLAQTAAFSTWLLGHILLALNLKQEKLPLSKEGLLSNRFGVIWLVGMICMTAIVTNVPFIFPYLKTTPLPPFLWLAILATILVTTFWIEIRKVVRLAPV